MSSEMELTYIGRRLEEMNKYLKHLTMLKIIEISQNNAWIDKSENKALEEIKKEYQLG